MRFSLELVKRLYRTGFLLVIILVLLDLFAYFYYPETVFGDIFLATREQTPLTWISALAMFFIAFSCFGMYFETKKKVWYFLSVTFFFFSMDDAVYLHERVSGFFQDNTTIFNFFPSYIWVVIYFPILIFSLSALIYLVWRDSLSKGKKSVIIALLILGIAIFLDLLDGFIQKNAGLVFCLNQSCQEMFTHLIRLVEEALEVTALGILGYTNIRIHCVDDESKEKGVV
ncbi:MAG: hypothetical protein OEV93_03850 [Candidatus Moranbacteria bacterium]|nr:hypothetical protein [Candidatus Moranbacteria bacterium]